MPQTNFGQPVMPQPTIGMANPRLNTIWNPSQQSILVASQVPLYQHGQPLGQPMEELPFQGMYFNSNQLSKLTHRHLPNNRFIIPP